MIRPLPWLVLDPGGSARVQANYRLGPGPAPRTLDLTPTGGPECGRRVQGIYDLQQGLLRVCLNSGKGKRPTDCSVATDSRWTLLTLQRDT
jgi:uncharacterized protein (TIGR03067 family)